MLKTGEGSMVNTSSYIEIMGPRYETRANNGVLYINSSYVGLDFITLLDSY